MFYVVSREYSGPPCHRAEPETIEIRNEPPLTDPGKRPRVKGWLGTRNSIERHAHGEFASLADARAFIRDEWGPCRKVDLRSEWGFHDAAVVERYRPRAAEK